MQTMLVLIVACGLLGGCTAEKEPLESEHVNVSLNAAKLGAPAFKVADFGDKPFTIGDCLSDHVVVTIRTDGSGHLGSVSFRRGTDSGDSWSWGISGYDARNTRIWSIARHRGPRMNDGTPPPRHANDFDFTYPAMQFEPTTTITVSYSC